MNVPSRILATLFLVSALPSATLAANTHVPTPSTWKLDVAASDFGGGPVMKADTQLIQTDTDKWLKFSEVMVDGDGKTWKLSWSGPPDGTSKPVAGMPGASASFKASEDTGHFVYPDGTSMDSTFVLSGDGKTMTLKAVGSSKDGKQIHQTLVYHRIK